MADPGSAIGTAIAEILGKTENNMAVAKRIAIIFFIVTIK